MRNTHSERAGGAVGRPSRDAQDVLVALDIHAHHARRVGLPLRRLAGVLAGRLDQAAIVLPGHGGAAPTLELSEVSAQPGHLAAILKDTRSILLIHHILGRFYDACGTAQKRNFTDI